MPSEIEIHFARPYQLIQISNTCQCLVHVRSITTSKLLVNEQIFHIELPAWYVCTAGSHILYINFLKEKSKFQQYKSAGNKILYHILQLNSFVPVIWQEICLPFSTLFFFNSTYFPKIPPISLKFHENRWNVKKKKSPISGFESVVEIQFSTESQNRKESRGHFLWCDIWRNIVMYEGMAPAVRETKFDWFLSQKIK